MIQLSKIQFHNPAKRMAKLLHAHGLEDAVLDENFHARILNPPFLPLVIETRRIFSTEHPNGILEVLFTHYYRDNGDPVIESELSFLTHEETGYLKLRGLRTCGSTSSTPLKAPDSVFANMMTLNIIRQGFLDGMLECECLKSEAEPPGMKM